MSLRVLAAVMLLALVSVPLAQTQQSPPASQQPPTFRTGAEIVRVDATVLDGKGQPVTSLTADDFVLEEDGVEQKIQSFKLVELSGQRSPASDVRLEIGSIAHGASEAARDDVRVFVVFWNEFHIPPNYHATRLRDDLLKFLQTMIGPTDLVAVMDQWTPMSHLRFTRDRGLLLATVMSLKGRQGVFVPPRNVAEENHLREGRRAGAFRAQVSLSALKSTLLHLGALREGRKALLYVSREIFGAGHSDLEAMELIQTANDANVAVYSINPDGIEMGIRTGILSDLARNTGGEALVTNTPETAFRRVVNQASAYYLLGYAPEPMRHDGRFHKIKVDVKRSGLQVRARNGYWAPTPGAKAEARARAAAAVVAPEIAAVFGELARLGRGGTQEPLTLRTIVVPDPPTPGLTIPPPDVWCVTRPADRRVVLSDNPPPPETRREFTRLDRLLLRLSARGTAADAATVTAALIDRQGKRLTTLPIARQADVWLLDLPLASIARGDYALMLEATAGEEQAAAYVPLRVR